MPLIRVTVPFSTFGPAGFLAYAKEFLKAARVAKVPVGRYSPVPFYLYCRSIELALKAFLLERGVAIAELKGRTLGHDLEAVLSRAKTLGLDNHVKATTAQTRELWIANLHYKAKGFEYYNPGRPPFVESDELPRLFLLDRLASHLVAGLERVCAARLFRGAALEEVD